MCPWTAVCVSPSPVSRTTEVEEGDSSASGDEASIATQQAPSSSPDVSRASSEAGEGSTTGPSTSRGPSSQAAAASPAAQPRRHRLCHRDQLLRWHMQAVERIEASICQCVEGDLQ